MQFSSMLQLKICTSIWCHKKWKCNRIINKTRYISPIIHTPTLKVKVVLGHILLLLVAWEDLHTVIYITNQYLLTPAIGTFLSTESTIYPYISEQLRISGNIFWGTSNTLHKYESHFSVCMFINIVLEAFVTSVMCRPPFTPPVKF